jgi:hypothetical protein
MCHLSPTQQEHLLVAQNIVKKLHSHQFYGFVDSHITPTKFDTTRFVASLGHDPNLIIYQTKVGFVSGNKSNPLDDIYVYKTKDSGKSVKIEATKKNKEDITAMMPSTYQEHVTMVFYKNKYDVIRINDIKQTFSEYIKMCSE